MKQGAVFIQERPLVGEEFDLEIERLGVYGEGVGKHHGYTIFVQGALPKERVRVRLQERRKNFGRAEVLQYHTSSPHRVDPICPLFGKCGGCQLMHLSYEEQLNIKRDKVVDALKRIGHCIDPSVSHCVPSDLPLAYRNKIQMPVGSKEGSTYLGLYAQASHDLIEVPRCYIHTDLGEHVMRTIQMKCREYKGGDSLRAVLIKTAVEKGEVLVSFITKVRQKEYIERLGKEIMDLHPEVKGIVENVNPSSSNTILGPTYYPILGTPFIEETLCGLTFKISAASFFQVNRGQAEKLYQIALHFLALSATETVLDAYCGVGTFSLILAQYAKRVIGIEVVPEAIADAKENKERNRIDKVDFLCGRAEVLIEKLQGIDSALLNPPRGGCERIFLEALLTLKPAKIVYISCDPATLARDVAILTAGGYTLNVVTPLDMFPQTAHVESIACLSSFSFKSIHK